MDGNVILAVQHYFRRLLLAPSMDGNVILAVQHYFRRLLLAPFMDRIVCKSPPVAVVQLSTYCLSYFLLIIHLLIN